MNQQKYKFPAYSSLFHVVDGLIIMRKNLSYKIARIFPDTNDENLKILNEPRLKKKIFKEILKRYNTRIENYKLLLNKIKNSDIENIEIVRYKLVSNTSFDNSGHYSVYPRTFICRSCGHLKNFKNNQEWDQFDPKKCDYPDCDGIYEQMSLLRFCEQCGKLEPLNYYCKEHGTKYWRLIRPDRDSLIDWKVICTECQKSGKKPNDMLYYKCNHSIYGENICSEPLKKFRPLRTMEGSVLNSVVITMVDLPPANYEDILTDLEYILLGLYLHKFDSIFKKMEPEKEVNLEKINSLFSMKNNPDLQSYIDNGMISSSFIRHIEEFEYAVEALKAEFSDFSLENINDYLILKGVFSKDKSNIFSFDQYLESKEDQNHRNTLRDEYVNLKNEFNIESITYISDIHLISSAVGLIKGINQFYKNDYVPHFEPIWGDKEKKSIKAYSYPFETEGILFDLDKIQLVNWLIENKILNEDLVSNEEEASNILFNINEETEEYNELKTLLHTISHVLIGRSPIYTGLDSGSCSELIFVNSGSFLIYSTSNINIGGFSYVFENSIFDWFRDVKLDVKDCIFDPTCIHETGSCFSCLFLPEYVCSEFNQFLDRDVLIGKIRYYKGFWNY
ncbi:MAG: hypothetical protein ACP5C3_07315 [Methanomicrobiales archaeon]